MGRGARPLKVFQMPDVQELLGRTDVEMLYLFAGASTSIPGDLRCITCDGRGARSRSHFRFGKKIQMKQLDHFGCTTILAVQSWLH